MLLVRVSARRMAGCEPVMDVTPMIRRDIGPGDVERLYGIDRAQHLFDFRPALDLEENLATGPHEG
ncbi:hypothetical protein D9M70_568830 [compost metagenome]